MKSALKEYTKRFEDKMHKPFPLPEATWINKPENDKTVLLQFVVKCVSFSLTDSDWFNNILHT